MQLVTVDAANAGRRLDAYLRQLLVDTPLGTIMKWVRTGRVRVNGKRAKPATRLAEGDEVRCPDTTGVVHEPRRHGPRKAGTLKVVYEDDDLLIVDKPAGLACHAGTKHEGDSLSARVVAYLGREDAPVGHRPGLAQRLDKGVSGLVPVGKHAAALRALAAAVESGSARKLYLTLVDGVVEDDAGRVDVPLRVDDEPMGDRPRVFPDAQHGKPARTVFQVRERFADATLLEVRLETGRTHQIRAHLLALGHPILGCPRYGPKGRNQRLHETYGIERPLLHAAELDLPHPTRAGELVRAQTDLPEDFLRLLRALRSSGAPAPRRRPRPPAP